MELLLFLLLVLLVDLAADPLGGWQPRRQRSSWIGTSAVTFLSMWEPDEKPGGVRNPPGLFEPTVCNGTFQMKGAQWIHRFRLQNNWQQRHTQGQALLKWTSLPSTALPLRKSLPCSGGGGWYQSGGSDRMQDVAKLRVPQVAVVTGKLAP